MGGVGGGVGGGGGGGGDKHIHLAHHGIDPHVMTGADVALFRALPWWGLIALVIFGGVATVQRRRQRRTERMERGEGKGRQGGGRRAVVV